MHGAKIFLQFRIVDLGCGTGSTLRALAPRLPGRQDWRLFDNDFDLVARAAATAPPATVTVTATPLDLSRDLEASLDGSIDLITASALLDLQLVVEILARSIPLYAAISHDGRIEIVPSDPFDTTIVAAVNLHQRTDKGFGPALGGTSASFAITRLKSFGYSVIHGTSDWVLEPHACDVQMELFSSWAATARQTGQAPVDTSNWLARRRESIAARQSSIRVGHVDFWAHQTGNL